MLYILALSITIYILSYSLLRKNQVFIKIKKWVDLSMVIIILTIIILQFEIFHYSFYLFSYLFVSLPLIIWLFLRLRKTEEKKRKAEEKIALLKDEEELLEENLRETANDQTQTPKQ